MAENFVETALDDKQIYKQVKIMVLTTFPSNHIVLLSELQQSLVHTSPHSQNSLYIHNSNMLDLLLSSLQGITPAGPDGASGNPLFVVGRLVLLTFMAGMTPLIVSKVKLWLYDGE
jgi:hypothetical protein